MEIYLDIGKEDGAPFKIDAEKVLSGRTAVIGMSGAGKSHLVAVICEEMAKNDLPFVVIDPEGEYSSLKEKYQVVWASNESGADVILNRRTAKTLAAAIIEQCGRLIIDTSGSEDEFRIVSDFLKEFYRIESEKKDPILLIVEEADRFAPQSSGEVVKELHEISRRGRKRGIGLLVATQRPAMVDKNVLSQCANQLIGRLRSERDLKAVSLFFSSSREIKKLPELKRGTFFVMGDISSDPSLVHIKQRETKSIGSTPKIKEKKSFSVEDFRLELGGEEEGISAQESVQIAEQKEAESPKIEERKAIDKARKEKTEAKDEGGVPVYGLPFALKDTEALEIATKNLSRLLLLVGNPTESIEEIKPVYWPYMVYKTEIASRGVLGLSVKDFYGIWDPISFSFVRFQRDEIFEIAGFNEKLTGLSWKALKVLIELNNEDMTVNDMASRTKLSPSEVRSALNYMRKSKIVVEAGKAGRATLYRPTVSIRRTGASAIKATPPQKVFPLTTSGITVLKPRANADFAANLIRAMVDNSAVTPKGLFHIPYYYVSLWKKKGTKQRVLLINGITGGVREITENKGAAKYVR